MIIRIENLGPVKRVDIDFSKPMIILTGLNGTGKTYVSYVLYAICRLFVYEKDFLKWADIVNSQIKEISGELDVDQLYELLLAHLKIVNELLYVAFGVGIKDDLIKDTKLTLLTTKEQFHEEILSEEDIINVEGIFDFFKERDSLKYSLIYKGGELDEAIVVNYIVVKSLLFNAVSEDVEPSDRGGLSTFNNEIIKGLEINKEEDSTSSGEDKYRQPLAISRFLADLNENLKKLLDNSKFRFLADEIENDIMHGHLSVSESGGVFYKKEGMNKEIPLSLSSSGVKTICSIILFLRYSAMDCNLIFIDEPEINLHPKYQVLIARVLSKIVNAGIRLIINTHSDYIIREFNNMIMLSSIKDKEKIKLLGYKEQEVLSKEDIAPYQFEFQEDESFVLGKEIEVTDTGFDIREIDDVINSQVEVSQNIYEIIEGV